MPYLYSYADISEYFGSYSQRLQLGLQPLYQDAIDCIDQGNVFFVDIYNGQPYGYCQCPVSIPEPTPTPTPEPTPTPTPEPTPTPTPEPTGFWSWINGMWQWINQQWNEEVKRFLFGSGAVALYNENTGEIEYNDGTIDYASTKEEAREKITQHVGESNHDEFWNIWERLQETDWGSVANTLKNFLVILIIYKIVSAGTSLAKKL